MPVAAIFIEGLALLLNRWKCPLTTFAERHGAENGSVSDIFLPQWMTQHVFGFATALFAVELIVLSLRYFLG